MYYYLCGCYKESGRIFCVFDAICDWVASQVNSEREVMLIF